MEWRNVRCPARRRLRRQVCLQIISCLFVFLAVQSTRAQGLSSQIPAAEYSALVDLYNDTSGDSWFTNSGWLDPSASNWVGVYVASGHVAQLYLPGNQLNGAIPDTLSNLSALIALDLRSNRLSSNIPGGFGSLTQLEYLFLGSNDLRGAIPDSLTNLSLLLDLDLDNNQLSGNIPNVTGAFDQLALMDLQGNQLTGPIPASLGNLSQLFILSLSGNQLSGSIPPNLANLSSLYELDLSANELTGVVPDFTNFNGLFINVESNDLDVATGSESLMNINKMIDNGITVYYLPQFGAAAAAMVLGPVARLPGGLVRVQAQGTPGATYTIQTSTDLVHWIVLSNFTLTTNTGQFVDSTNSPVKFYRTVAAP